MDFSLFVSMQGIFLSFFEGKGHRCFQRGQSRLRGIVFYWLAVSTVGVALQVSAQLRNAY